MSIETQYQNGSDTRYDVDQMQKALLKRLEQQNRCVCVCVCGWVAMISKTININTERPLCPS